MTGDPSKAENQTQPYVGKGCPKCGYDLTGTLEPRCPECGSSFDPAKLRPVKLWRRLSWRITIPCVLLAVYLPNTWVFWIDYPWGGYRMTWVKMFPILPALLPMAWARQYIGRQNSFSDTSNIIYFGIASILLISVCILLGKRSRVWLLLVCLVVFVLEVFNALGSHALFRM